MIHLYTGTPSSGKSYNTIRQIEEALWQRKFVLCNFPYNFSPLELQKGRDKYFTYVTNNDLTIEFLIKFAVKNGMIRARKESQCLVIVDEAGGRYNAREFQKSDRADWIDFFSQHAKLGFDFILVAQNDRMIDKQIRGYIEYEKVHRKVNNFGFPLNILSLFGITAFISIERWYQVKQKLSSEFFFYRKKIAEKYDRFRMFDGFKLSGPLMQLIEDDKLKDELEKQIQEIKADFKIEPSVSVEDLKVILDNLPKTSINAIYNKDAEQE